jgi:sulfur-carrier protein
MKVTVEISFSFREELSEHPVTLILEDGSDVAAGLHALVKRFPEILPRIFTDDGDIRAFINVLQNGANVRFKKGFHTELQDGDRLSVLPPVGGG